LVTVEALWAMPLLRLALGAALGVIFGSFVGAAVVRLPLGLSPLTGRSRCDGCGRTLAAAELVPILSFVILGGKCRACGTGIDRWQPAAEIGGALIGASAAVFALDAAAMALSLMLGLQLLALGLLDARHLWLPHKLVLLLAASGLVAGWWRFGVTAPLASEVALGGIFGFVLLWLPAALYRRLRKREGMGAGDPKLMAALGLWFGPLGVVLTILAASLGGLALAAGLALGGRKVDAATPLPFGSALALAGWTVWLGGKGGWACC
jgi:leader peptidase (prepilin peptidase) / N-methyltransferase